MAEPLEYTSLPPSRAKRRPIVLLAAVFFASLTLWVTYLTIVAAATIEYAGYYHASVSFEDRLSLKGYNVQWPAFFWLLPLTGIATGILAERDGWRWSGRRCWVASAICAAGWLAMDILWR